jgi:hypothetical protein
MVLLEPSGKEENEYDFKCFLHCLWMKKLLKMSDHSVFYIQERRGGRGDIYSRHRAWN